MRNYYASPKDYKLHKKYCLLLDKNIISLQNYIDFINPNYIVLNRKEGAEDVDYYSKESLASCGILYDNYSAINPNQLFPGQVLQNIYGQNLSIADSQDYLEPSFALIKKNQGYWKMSLDAAGDYYVLTKLERTDENTVKWHWDAMERATLRYGLSYYFSFIPVNARFYIENNVVPYPNFTLESHHFDDNSIVPIIRTLNGSIWTDQYVLAHEFYIIDSGNYYDEVLGDTVATVTTRIDDSKRVIYNYNMNTNFTRGQIGTIKINLY